MNDSLEHALNSEMISLVVTYRDDRNESVRTAVVMIPEGAYYLIPFRLRAQGRKVRGVISFYREESPETVTFWKDIA